MLRSARFWRFATGRPWLEWWRSVLVTLLAFLVGGTDLLVTVAPALLEGTAVGGWVATVIPEFEDPTWQEVVVLGNGATHTLLKPDTDYLVVLPDEPKVGSTTLVGGRNILIDGGHIVMQRGTSDVERRAIYIKDATGKVRIQNVYIEGTDHAVFDAFAISAPAAAVRLVNIRVDGVRGASGGFHGDIVQPFGGVKRLTIDGLSGRSNYQAFYLQETRGPIGSVVLRNIDLAYRRNRQDETTFMLWLDGCSPTYPVRLRNVYIEARDGQHVVSHAVRPNEGRPGRCRAVQDGDTVGWPDIPEIDGVVIEGRPPGGDFVKRSKCRSNPEMRCVRPRRAEESEPREPAPEAEEVAPSVDGLPIIAPVNDD